MDDYNWFNLDLKNDEFQIKSIKNEKSIFSLIFDFISVLSSYIIFISLFMCGLIYIVEDDNVFLVDKEFKEINLIIFIYVTIYRLMLFLMNLFAVICKYVKALNILRYFDKVYRQVVLLLFSLFIFTITKLSEKMPEHALLDEIMTCMVVTLVFYMIFEIFLMMAENKFIWENLQRKIASTGPTELCLKCLKDFANSDESRHEESTSSETPGMILTLLKTRVGFESLSEFIKTEPGSEIDNFNLQIEVPAVPSIEQLIVVAKKTFEKASSNGEFLTPNELKSIFSDENTNKEASKYFDLSENSNIEKNTFRDVLIFFYKNRVSLENSIHSVFHFVTMMRGVINAIILIFLVIIDLMLLGFDVKKIFAITLSFGLATNFLAKDLIKDFSENLIFLFSHQFDLDDTVMVEGKAMKVQNIGLLTSTFTQENGGRYKVMNRKLWEKEIVNLTNTTERFNIFTLHLPIDITHDQILKMKETIKSYLKSRPTDYYEEFVLGSLENAKYEADKLNTMIKLKCKTFMDSKKFILHAEFTNFLNKYIKNELGAKEI